GVVLHLLFGRLPEIGDGPPLEVPWGDLGQNHRTECSSRALDRRRDRSAWIAHRASSWPMACSVPLDHVMGEFSDDGLGISSGTGLVPSARWRNWRRSPSRSCQTDGVRMHWPTAATCSLGEQEGDKMRLLGNSGEEGAAVAGRSPSAVIKASRIG